MGFLYKKTASNISKTLLFLIPLCLVQIVSTILCSPFLMFAFILPESPRWLFAHNSEEKGIKVAEKMAQINNVKVRKETWDKARRLGEKVMVKDIRFRL